MNPAGSDAAVATIRLQELMGRMVVDTTGRRLGRVVECVAEPDGADLQVVGLLVGYRAWAARFGSVFTRRGHFVPWQAIVSLSPHITVQQHPPLTAP